jgi:hypothetical protein
VEKKRQKTAFTPHLKRSNTEKALEIFGKSSSEA